MFANKRHLCRSTIVLTLVAQLGGAAGCASRTASATTSQPASAEPKSNFKSVIAVVAVVDQPAAVDWYKRCLGRDVDLAPAEGVAEWELAPNAWLQVAADPDRAGKSSVIVVVHNLEAQRKTCSDAGIALGNVQDFGVVKMVDATDPEGNTLFFVQEVAPTPNEAGAASAR